MGTPYWLGTADAVAQIDTATPVNVEVGDIFNLLIDGDVMATFTATAANVANVTAGLSAAWQTEKTDSGNPWMADITATDSTTHITLTASTPGLPFTITSSTTDGGGNDTQDLTMATTTSCAGPNHWDTAANWSEGAVPVNDDDVYIENNNVSILWGLAQSAVTLGSLNIYQSYTGKIGLNRTVFTNNAGGTSYTSDKEEYRDHYLDIGWKEASIGEHYGSGSPVGSSRLKLDNAYESGGSTLVFNTGASSVDTGFPVLRLLFNDATGALYVDRAPGGVGVAVDEPGETSVIDTITIGSGAGKSRVVVGEGVNLETWEQYAGVSIIDADADTIQKLTVDGGQCTLTGACAVAAAYAMDGTIYPNTSGTIAELRLYGGTADFTKVGYARTVSDLYLTESDGRIIYDAAVVTITTVHLPSSRLVDMTYAIGTGVWSSTPSHRLTGRG